MKSNSRTIGRGALLLAVLAALFLVLGVLPGFFVRLDLNGGTLKPAELVEAKNNVRGNLLQALAGLGLAATALATWRSLQINRDVQITAREGQITERFTRAIDQLGNRESLDVRLGGIYALERIARDSGKDHGPVMEVLTAFVREQAPFTRKSEKKLKEESKATDPANPRTSLDLGEAPEPRKVSMDVQAALKVIGRREVGHDRPGRLDLSASDLGGADLRDAHLEGAVLSHAHLEDAVLIWAHLGGAVLSHAHLEGAVLRDAHLEGAVLRDAHLESAVLLDAHLERGFLRDAHLEGAVLTSAVLTNAHLEAARANRRTTWPDDFNYEAAGVVIERD